MVKLGDKVKHHISEFGGIVTGRAEYLYGCVQVLVNPGKVHEGKLVDSIWLDEDSVAVVTPEAVAAPSSAADRNGGPALSALPPSGNR